MATVATVFDLTISNKILGKGVFGTVYEGTFRGVPVAVKKVQQLDVNDREQVAMRTLDHPNVVQLIGIQNRDDFRCFILELCAATVEEYCKNKYDGPMPSELHSLQHMARGLAHIHSKKLFHRDVKPENILISLPDESGAVQLKISDFGLCKPTTENGTCSASGIKGTPVYTAPEVLSLGGRPLDGTRMSYSSDVFSLGCTFFYFLTKGTHPFGSQTIKIPNNILNGRPELSKLSDHFAIQLISRMIAHAEQTRPKMADLVTELEHFQLQVPGQFENILAPCDDLVSLCRFHPHKPILACALDNGRVCIFAGETSSTPFARWHKRYWKARTSSLIWSLNWNADGSQLAAGCENGSVIVWHENGSSLLENNQEHDHFIECLTWNRHSGGDHLFATGDRNGVAVVWDSNQKVAVLRFNLHKYLIHDICWIDVETFASCSWNGTIFVCRIRGRSYYELNHQGLVHSIRCINTFQYLVSCSSEGNLKIWNLGTRNGTKLEGDGCGNALDWCENRSVLAFGSGRNILLWEIKEMEVKYLTKLIGHSDSDVLSVAFSDNAMLLASLHSDGRVDIWSTQSWRVVSSIPARYGMGRTSGKTNYYKSLTWDSTSRKLAAPYDSTEVMIFSV